MLPGLKRQCSNCIGKYINSDNVLQVLRSARLFNQARLEDQCSEFIANNLVNVSSVAVEISCIGIFGKCYFCPFTLSNGFIPFLNLSRHSCVKKKIITWELEFAKLKIYSDNKGERGKNKTEMTISLYTVFIYMYI